MHRPHFVPSIRPLDCIAFLVTTACISPVAFGQGQWQQQSPYPTDRQLNSVAFTSPQQVWICGGNRHLLRSNDGGQTFSTVMASDFGTDPFYDVYFVDALHGYVTGNNNDAWRTTDGGETWQQMTTVPFGSWYHIDFITPTVGFIGANGAVAFTDDGGVSWDIPSDYPECPVMYGMDFRDTSIGLAAGWLPETNENGVFKTADGGVTWTRTLDQTSNDVLWLTEDIVLAITADLHLYRSDDLGDTWIEIAGPIEKGPASLARLDDSTICGVSTAGEITRSADGGASWSLVFDKGIGDLPAKWGIRFFDDQTGWVVGPYGIILGSIDGGVTWDYVNNGVGAEMRAIQMFNTSFGIAVGLNGYTLVTHDGGNTWDLQRLKVLGDVFPFHDEDLNGVSIVDDEFAVAAGPAGIVFRTGDAGLTWESIGYPALPDTFFIEDVAFTSRDEGWLVGLDQELGHDKAVYRTTDGGNTWTLAMNENMFFMSADFTSTGLKGWITTIDEAYLRTVDGGETWIDGILPGDVASISEIDFAGPNKGWVVGWYGYVARSTNGGASWTLQDIGEPEVNMLALSVVGPSEAWTVGASNFDQVWAIHTVNGGTTWTREQITSWPYSLDAVSAPAPAICWVAGYNGIIFTNYVRGDLDGDGDVDGADLNIFVEVLLGTDGDPDHVSRSDLNGDGTSDGDDVQGFVNVMISS